MLNLYPLFNKENNEATIYRLICYIEVPFKAGWTVSGLLLNWNFTQNSINRKFN